MYAQWVPSLSKTRSAPPARLRPQEDNVIISIIIKQTHANNNDNSCNYNYATNIDRNDNIDNDNENHNNNNNTTNNITYRYNSCLWLLHICIYTHI